MRVIKIGGRAQKNARLGEIVRQLWDNSADGLCLVHGGGDEISAIQRALGREAVFIGGRRVTSKADLELLRMVLSGLVNKRLVNAFVSAGIPAVGISGEDNSLISATLIDASALGCAGRPTTINTRLLKTLIDARYMPVISPVGYDIASGQGGALNVNGDDAAAAIATSLKAEELVFVADVEGVQDDRGNLLPNLTGESADELVMAGIAAGGMAAKIESAREALLAGVDRVRICDLGGLIDHDSGTFIVQAEGIAS